MKRLLLILLLLSPLLSTGQAVRGVSYFSKDSLPRYLTHNWRFHEGDSAAWAAPGYNDSAWVILSAPDMRIKNRAENASDTFNSIGWLRLRFLADTALTEKPLVIEVTQYGASEIYLDGRKVATYGTINGPDSSPYGTT